MQPHHIYAGICINISDLWTIPVTSPLFRISRRPRRSNCIQYLKEIDKRKRAANTIKNEDIGVTKLNIRKENKLLDKRLIEYG
jgi:hypothetical protein